MGTVIIILSLIVALLAFLSGYDIYKYPICLRCGHNMNTKRRKGKIICSVHGEC